MYDIKRTSIQGDYSLIQGDQEIFVFKASKMLSSTSEAYYMGQRIEINKKGPFSRTHQVFRSGELIAEIVVDWLYNSTIHIRDLDGNPKRLSFKRRGFFTPTFDLICTDPTIKLLSMDFKLRMEKMNITYRLDVAPIGEEMFDMPELIICCMHALRRYRRNVSNA
ncbi:MAG TPA: hypothetical protein DCS93_10075 [Microscillaceae bacterium]|nr:hypothetical protein [Microscillaceae bacterium]